MLKLFAVRPAIAPQPEALLHSFQPSEAIGVEQLPLARPREFEAIQPGTEHFEMVLSHRAMGSEDIRGLFGIGCPMIKLGPFQPILRRVDERPFVGPYREAADIFFARMAAAYCEFLFRRSTVQSCNE